MINVSVSYVFNYYKYISYIIIVYKLYLVYFCLYYWRETHAQI